MHLFSTAFSQTHAHHPGHSFCPMSKKPRTETPLNLMLSGVVRQCKSHSGRCACLSCIGLYIVGKVNLLALRQMSSCFHEFECMVAHAHGLTSSVCLGWESKRVCSDGCLSITDFRRSTTVAQSRSSSSRGCCM